MKLLTYTYLSIIFLFFLFSYLFIDPNFTYLEDLYSGFYSVHRNLASLVYLLLLMAMFGVYILILKNTSRVEYQKRFLLFMAVVGIFSYPAIFSYDIFNYIATAKVAFFYFENPYIIMPIEFTQDPILQFTHAANKLALYGPVWIILTGVPFILSSGNYLMSIILFKLLTVSFFLGTVLLIWKITKNKFSVLFFSLNPLVLIETFISSHNDIVMMFLALLSFYFLTSKKIIYAILFLILSILIKYAAIFLLPVFIYTLYKLFNGMSIDWRKIWLFAFISMFIIFIFSFLREEIYPWYAIWPMTFLALIPEKKNLIIIFIALTFGLMLRYVPFMLIGTHFGITPISKTVLTFIPPLFVFGLTIFKKKIV